MSDVLKAVSTAFGVMGLKPRDPQACVDYITSKGFEVTDADGFLQVTQGAEKTQVNVASILQANFKQQPQMFHGHSGQVLYKSDVLDNQAKIKFINDHGYDAWAALPINADSPSARNTITATIVSTELTRKQWFTLSTKERCDAISGWGKEGLKNVERICARTK